MIATQYIKLNMVPSGYPPVLYMSQYDVGRPVGFVVSASGSTPDLDGYTVTLEGTRSDGTPVTAPVTTDGNICALETTATMTNKVDRYPAQIVVTDGNGNRIASIPVTMMVVKAAMNENAEGVEEDRSLYQQYTGTVQSLIADIRTQLGAEASARQAADNQLQSNINAEASTRATQDASLQSQINQLIAPSGEAPSAAEVENARVGADGTVYPTLGDAIRTQDTQLKSALAAYNAFGAVSLSGTFADVTDGGTTYTWEGITCHAIGSPTSVSFCTIFEKKNEFPFGLSAGNTYRVKCSSTDNNLYAEVRYYVGNSSTYLTEFITDGTFTIPSNATGLWLRIRIRTNTTVDGYITFDIIPILSNKELEEKSDELQALINNRTRSSEQVQTDFFGTWNKSLDSVADGSQSLLTDIPPNTRKYAQTAKFNPNELDLIAEGPSYIEKCSAGGFSYYKILKNADGREQLGFVIDGDIIWYNKGARRPKRIAMFGDSTMRGVIGGSSGYAFNNIPYYVGLLTGQPTTNFGVGSIGLIQKPILDYNGEEYIAQQDLSGYDVCVLMYGLNDSSGVLGTADDTTEQTFMGATYRVVTEIMTRYPKMQIILVSPILTKSSAGVFPGWGYSMMRGSAAPYWNYEMMVEEYEKFSKKYHIPYINGGKCFNSWNVQTLIGDSVHPTVTGYSVCGPYIASQIASLL